MISVIVPIYNSEHTLHRCINSILAQTYTDFEVLLVNDGSIDSSAVVCEEYVNKDDRVRLINKANGGVSSARNIGLDNAKGEWVTFCDADDWVGPCWLELFVRRQANAALVCQGIFLKKVGEKDFGLKGCDCSGEVSQCLQRLIDEAMFGGCTIKLFKMQLIRQGNLRFNETLKFKEDEEFVIRYMFQMEYESLQSIKEGAYYYDEPDFKIKYQHTDEFETLFSTFETVKKIHRRTPIKDSYEHFLKELSYGLIDSFLKGLPNGLERIKRYQRLVGRNNIRNARWLGMTAKYLLSAPAYIAYGLLTFKFRLENKKRLRRGISHCSHI